MERGLHTLYETASKEKSSGQYAACIESVILNYIG